MAQSNMVEEKVRVEIHVYSRLCKLHLTTENKLMKTRTTVEL